MASLRRPCRAAPSCSSPWASSLFLGISLLLARYLSTENRERDAVYALLRDQARGDVRGMLSRLDGCDARCRAAVEANARRLARPGDVKILAYTSSTSYALGVGDAVRPAWRGRSSTASCRSCSAWRCSGPGAC